MSCRALSPTSRSARQPALRSLPGLPPPGPDLGSLLLTAPSPCFLIVWSTFSETCSRCQLPMGAPCALCRAPSFDPSDGARPFFCNQQPSSFLAPDTGPSPTASQACRFSFLTTVAPLAFRAPTAFYGVQAFPPANPATF